MYYTFRFSTTSKAIVVYKFKSFTRGKIVKSKYLIEKPITMIKPEVVFKIHEGNYYFGNNIIDESMIFTNKKVIEYVFNDLIMIFTNN